MTPKLTIIIPCYNCMATLEEAFHSIYDQQLNIPFEVVMVDDGSTDQTPALMRELAHSQNNVRIFFHEHNRGGGATRNTAVAQASAETIFCLDSDDILPSGGLAKMYALMLEKQCDGVGIGKSIKFRGIDKNQVEIIHHFGTKEREITFDELLQKHSLCALYSTFMITKQAFAITGGYPEDHGFDTQGMAWRFLARGLKAYVCPEAGYLHRVNFHRSYYVREYEAGKATHNWFKILDEFLYLLSDRAKNIVLGTDLNDYKKNVYDLVRALESPFAVDYIRYLTPEGKTKRRQELEKTNPSQLTMFDAYWLGSEHLRDDRYQEALVCLSEAQQKGLHSSAVQEKINIAQLCLTGKSLEVASAEIEQGKKYKKLGSQSPWIRRVFIAIKSRFRPLKVFYIELRDRRQSRNFSNKALALAFLYIRKRMMIRFKNYKSSQEMIDVVMPTISKDFPVLETSIQSLRNLDQKVNQIYIISRPDPEIISFCQQHQCQFVDEETVLGYSKSAINYSVKGSDRSGWLYQQLLKLGAANIVTRDNYFVLDSDTVLVSPNSFLQNGKFVFQEHSDWHQPYHQTFQKIFRLDPPNNLSSVCHMMLFNRARVMEMRAQIERISDQRWDQAIIAAIDQNEASSFSEYETYANWMSAYHQQEIKRIPFYNRALTRHELKPLAELEQQYSDKLKSVSFHSYAS